MATTKVGIAPDRSDGLKHELRNQIPSPQFPGLCRNDHRCGEPNYELFSRNIPEKLRKLCQGCNRCRRLLIRDAGFGFAAEPDMAHAF